MFRTLNAKNSLRFGESNGNEPLNQLQTPSISELPWWELKPLQMAFLSGAAVVSDRAISRLFQRETEAILQVVSDATGEDIFAPTPIPRLVGLKKSSCSWSVAMAMDHLNQVNQSITGIIEELAKELKPVGSITIDDFQPDPAADWSTIDQFRDTSDRYLAEVAQHDSLNSFARFDHPWFGSLNAHQWHCLAAMHMIVHRRQARKIVALLGIT